MLRIRYKPGAVHYTVRVFFGRAGQGTLLGTLTVRADEWDDFLKSWPRVRFIEDEI